MRFETPPAPADLRPLFHPRSIVVVGASRNPASISGQPLHFLVRHGYAGALYAVNPSAKEIHGVACHPGVDALPCAPDLAIIALAADQVPAALEACGAKGTRVAIVLSSGFGELGQAAGRDAQREIAAIAKRHRMRLIGPNCQGLICTRSNVYAGFGGPMAIRYREGGLCVVSQSGGFGMAIASMADEAGMGISQVISTGNEADLGVLDVLSHGVDDPGTTVMAAYIEGLHEPRRLVDIGRRALAAAKPIIAWKVGVSRQGARAAASHTGNLGGDDDIYNGIFRQCGIVRAADGEETVDLAQVFSGGALPEGPKVAVLTVSGGAGVALADELAAQGCDVPEPGPALQQRLAGLLPDYVRCGNPVDVTAAAFNRPQIFGEALQVLADDAGFDVLVVVLASVPDAVAEPAAREIARVREGLGKPVVVCFSARQTAAPNAYRVLRDAGVPIVSTPLRTGRAVGKLVAYAGHRRALLGEPLLAELEAGLRTRRADVPEAGPACLTEYAAKQLLAEGMLPVTREALARSAEEAVALARRIGLPVAMKLQSPGLPHKSDHGAVRLGLREAEDIRSAFDALLQVAERGGHAADGVLVQEMVEAGQEIILGGLVHERFGPTVMVGFGGVYSEALQDSAFRLAPLSSGEAARMVAQLRCAPLLQGLRGRPAADQAALVRAIESFAAWLHANRGWVAEVDVNPLFVRGLGQGVVAADAMITRRA